MPASDCDMFKLVMPSTYNWEIMSLVEGKSAVRIGSPDVVF